MTQSTSFVGQLQIDVDAEPAPSGRGAERVVFQLTGELDAASVPGFRTALAEHLDPRHDAVVDLSGLTFIDSTGLGVLVGALKRHQDAGRALALRAPTSSLRRVLETTGLTAVFPIEP